MKPGEVKRVLHPFLVGKFRKEIPTDLLEKLHETKIEITSFASET